MFLIFSFCAIFIFAFIKNKTLILSSVRKEEGGTDAEVFAEQMTEI